MEEVFTSKSSAVARIISARAALLKDSDNALVSGDEKAARLERLERLLFDVRAGRTNDFTMPTANGDVRVFVSPD
ncbi:MULTISPECIES: hypothetical protein [Paraburkholderia]|jgi:hypothetical protein|uniref:hypothetical protein n=1 Tax=Paraburkholderia TaxID=1822464 RepID=UPI0006D3FF89|nr:MULTISPECIES: hypothetical protein [Paraburkholderia]ALP65780.1 hypothetical protein AN416_24935 [Paraburkholderia caribensis]AMV46285.1 hypothetical protein ATN79_30545 [Paraburkholderia caribensis]AUT55297.1 hypothetical protein C2L66_26600 [Paraburkholderia caribensis]MDR6381594.1 hypothetical protein [Paraburkholderia caribensis]CAG9216773.1 conserved hypothetical protein [Paraburkholderia caribensis]